TFHKSLRVSDTRFVVGNGKSVQLRRQVPASAETSRLGPCFLVSSGEPGMAGLCTLHVTAQVPGAVRPPMLLEQQILITEGRGVLGAGRVAVPDRGQRGPFELGLRSRVRGVLSLCPGPPATSNAEGASKAPADFAWPAAAEEELNDRLTRLLDNPPPTG